MPVLYEMIKWDWKGVGCKHLAFPWLHISTSIIYISFTEELLSQICCLNLVLLETWRPVISLFCIATRSRQQWNTMATVLSDNSFISWKHQYIFFRLIQYEDKGSPYSHVVASKRSAQLHYVYELKWKLLRNVTNRRCTCQWKWLRFLLIFNTITRIENRVGDNLYRNGAEMSFQFPIVRW